MMFQFQGIQGEAVVTIPRTLDNAGNGTSQAFPEGKKNHISIKFLDIIRSEFLKHGQPARKRFIHGLFPHLAMFFMQL